VTVVAPSTLAAPGLTQNGEPVAGLTATNLGASKSVVIAIDRSQSMAGQALDQATAAARAFVAAKPPAIASRSSRSDRSGLPDGLLDRDDRRRFGAPDDHGRLGRGTALYDAVVEGSHMLGAETCPARVLILLTDGNERRGEATARRGDPGRAGGRRRRLRDRHRGRPVLPEPLKQIAIETRGQYYGAASPAVLSDVYNSIAQDLRRTWQLEYMTNARPATSSS
jgi:hypothetical protein